MSTLTKLQYGQDNTVEQRDYTSEVFIDFQNNRLKLIDYFGDIEKIAKNAIALCGKYGMGKIIATIPKEHVHSFIKNDYVHESTIHSFFKGKDGYNVSYFYNKERAFSDRTEKEDEILNNAMKDWNQFTQTQYKNFSIRTGTEEDAEEMAKLYDIVFKTYPTPMDNPEFIKNMIRSDQVLFKLVEYNETIVSAASADLNHTYLNAEMTDCATLPNFRGKGLLSELIHHLEISLKNKRFITLYSIARAISPGINIVFSKHGYNYTGRQINNSQIMGKLEDMNIWEKQI